VAPKPVFGFEQDDGIVSCQKMGGGHAGNACANNSNAAGGAAKDFKRHGWS
jgi:hypothetical protein